MRFLPRLALPAVFVTLAGCAALGLEDDEAVEPDPLAGVSPPAATREESAQRSALEAWLATWPERPRLAAHQMLVRYGMPDEASEGKLLWRDRGPFRRIALSRVEVPHDFPKPHMDFLAHTIRYRVPADRCDDLFEFDGSLSIDRTAGELTAKCDSEAHNVLALNLAHEIVTGERTVDSAREAMGAMVLEHLAGTTPGALKALQFDPTGEGAADADRPSIEGAPLRATAETRALGERPDTGRHGETLALLFALAECQAAAADEVAQKDVDEGVKDFARRLHAEHGRHAAATLALGAKIGAPLVETEPVDRERRRAAARLADLLLLDGPGFERAFLDATVRAHEDAVSLIDDRIANVEDADLRVHLTQTRALLRRHLDEARRLLGGAERRG